MPTPAPRIRFIIGLAATLLAPFWATTARANDPAVDMWLQQRDTFENYVRNIRPLDKHQIGEVMELSVEKKFLILRTPLNDIRSEQSMRATFEGIHGVAIVSLRREDNSDLPVEPTAFSLNVMDFPAPRHATDIVIDQSSQTDDLKIREDIQTINGPCRDISFIQQKPGMSARSGLVQLIVNETPTQGVAPEQLTLESPDFVSFVRDHPAETNLYVRPLLRELRQEAVFAPDQLVAWQVFSDLWQPDAAVTQRVRSLLPSLNSGDYHQRNATLDRLRELGRNGAAVLIHLDRSQLTAEQNARVDLALTSYAQLSATEAARRRSDAGFLLDCLYSDDLALRRAALDRLRQIARWDLPFDVGADIESRSTAIEALRQQLVPGGGQPAK